MLRYEATATLKAIGILTLVVGANGGPVCKPEASEHILRDVPTAELTALNPAKTHGLNGTSYAVYRTGC
jgi:hypothetical protein